MIHLLLTLKLFLYMTKFTTSTGCKPWRGTSFASWLQQIHEHIGLHWRSSDFNMLLDVMTGRNGWIGQKCYEVAQRHPTITRYKREIIIITINKWISSCIYPINEQQKFVTILLSVTTSVHSIDSFDYPFVWLTTSLQQNHNSKEAQISSCLLNYL
jgi:hypothetical protein